MKPFLFFFITAFLASIQISFAQYSGGSGTSGDPYKISTLDDLSELCQTSADWSGKYFIQTANIDASQTQYWDDSDDNSDGDNYNDPNDATSTGSNQGFFPLGNSTTNWNSFYDGSGYSISGITIVRKYTDQVGFFGWTSMSGKTIENLGLESVNIWGFDYVGGFVGFANYGTIQNCFSSGDIKGGSELGGFVGYASSVIIDRCYSKGSVYSDLSMYGNTYDVGGLIAYNNGATISNCYSHSSTYGYTRIAGFIANNNSGSVNKCYSKGVVLTGAVRGGFEAYQNSGTDNNCFFDFQTAGTSSGTGGTAANTLNMTQSGMFTSAGWDFVGETTNGTNDYWDVNSSINDSYPFLSWESFDPSISTQAVSNISTTTATGNGNITDLGYPAPTQHGVCWSTSENPTTGDNKTEEGSASSTGAFTSSMTGLSPNTLYYVRAYATNTEGTVYGDQVSFTTTYTDLSWDGSISNDWNTASNWDVNAVPDASKNVTITTSGTAPVIESGETADCNNLTVNSGATLTINSGGSLITAGTITNNGTIYIEHSMTDGKWHLVSSPIEGATANVFFGDYLQYFDETSASNNYIDIGDENTALNPCQGYAWRNYSKGSFTFSGTPYTGNQSISTTAQQANGWNLLGNPYPSSLDWNLLDDTYGTIYTFVDNGVNNGWRTYNNGAVVNGGTRYVAPMQGFFIATELTGVTSFAVTNSVRTHSGADGYVKSAESLPNSLKLVVSSAEQTDELFIQFGNQYLDGFDPLHDAWKMNSENEKSLQVFSKSTDGFLCIDRRPETKIIPLGFKNPINSQASISIIENEDLTDVIIEDTKFKKFHKLNTGSYEFTWNVADSENRFKLHFNATGIEGVENFDPQVYATNGQLYVRIDDANEFDELVVYDLSGRLVFQNNLSQQNLQSFDLGHLHGVYLVQLIGEDKSVTEKVILE